MSRAEPSDRFAARAGEELIELPAAADAQVHFIGRVLTPFATLADCPKNPLGGQVEATVEIDARYARGLEGIEKFSHLILLYWMDAARRDIILQTPRHLDAPRGVFALRSPVRPNPIALAVVDLVRVEGTRLIVKGIDCRNGTPLVDIKPYFASIDSVPGARRP